MVESHSTVIVPLDDGVLFVNLFNCTQFPSELSKVSQTLDPVSRIQFLAGGSGLIERWPLRTI